jgi:hypothetical protein
VLPVDVLPEGGIRAALIPGIGNSAPPFRGFIPSAVLPLDWHFLRRGAAAR